MKFKKYGYILIFILMLLIGIDNVYAAKSTGIFGLEGDKTKECYYMNDDGSFKARITLHWDLVEEYNEWYDYIINFDGWENYTSSGFTKVIIDKAGQEGYIKDKDHVSNWIVDTERNCIKNNSVCFDDVYPGITSYFDALYTEPSCPEYIVYEKEVSRWLWVTDSLEKAVDAQKKSDEIAYYAKQTTENEYWKDEIGSGDGLVTPDNSVSCDDYEAIFGDPNDNGVYPNDKDGDGEPSIRYYIDLILQYVRFIVPVLIILLGTIDLAKAVLASKEDEMRKAQTDFIKRVIIGIAIFFVPVFIDLVMDIAETIWKDTVWEGKDLICNLNK